MNNLTELNGMKILEDGYEDRLCFCLLETAVILVLIKKWLGLTLKGAIKIYFISLGDSG